MEIITLLMLRVLSLSNAQECKIKNKNHLNPVMLVFIRYYLLLLIHSSRPASPILTGDQLSASGDNNPSHAEVTFIIQCTRMQKNMKTILTLPMLPVLSLKVQGKLVLYKYKLSRYIGNIWEYFILPFQLRTMFYQF